MSHSGSSGPDVSIIVVTYDSERDLRTCLMAALGQSGIETEVLVVDNASTDASAEIARSLGSRVRVLGQTENLGFAQAMNIGIDATTGRYVLALNPDCRLEVDFCATLVDRADAHPDVGSATGRLLRAAGDELSSTDMIDSVGMYFTSSCRHLDRGSGEPAEGRYLAEEDVFGVTGAAGFYRRAALDSARISTGYYDRDFFAYREDADLAWRLQHLGWRCLYVPAALAAHRRANLPERRKAMSAAINYHSVKNRFLLRINNQTRREFVRTLLPTLARDLVVVVACLVRERSSLPAFAWLWRNRRRLLAKRREDPVTPTQASHRMKLAILGTRGIPPAYGGFETMAWELSRELAARGHQVTVYAYRGRTDETRGLPPGVRRRFVPGLPGKHLETVTHTAMGALDTVLHPYDAVLLVNAANALFAFLPRLRGAKVALNVDGIERQRAKWGLAGRLWYTLGERLSLVLPNEIISDAAVIADYYRERYGRESALIAYGATLLERDPPPDLARHGLAGIQPGRYLLYVSRLEPENQADLVIRAFADVPGDTPLLVVGDAPYATEYKAGLATLAAADPRVRLTGALYGEAYTDLQRGAMAYIQATSVGGTHPALIESMAAGNLVLAFGSPENREVTAGCALLFDDQAQLTEALTRAVKAPDSPEHQALRTAARARAASTYAWPAIADQYEALYERLRR